VRVSNPNYWFLMSWWPSINETQQWLHTEQKLGKNLQTDVNIPLLTLSTFLFCLVDWLHFRSNKEMEYIYVPCQSLIVDDNRLFLTLVNLTTIVSNEENQFRSRVLCMISNEDLLILLKIKLQWRMRYFCHYRCQFSFVSYLYNNAKRLNVVPVVRISTGCCEGRR